MSNIKKGKSSTSTLIKTLNNGIVNYKKPEAPTSIINPTIENALYLDTLNNTLYVCSDNTENNNVWVPLIGRTEEKPGTGVTGVTSKEHVEVMSIEDFKLIADFSSGTNFVYWIDVEFVNKTTKQTLDIKWEDAHGGMVVIPVKGSYTVRIGADETQIKMYAKGEGSISIVTYGSKRLEFIVKEVSNVNYK